MLRRRFGIIVFIISFLSITGLLFQEQVCAATKQDKIVINLPAYTLSYYVDGQLVKKYPIANGKPSTPTPTGEYHIISKVVNPVWYPPKGGEPVSSGPWNPLGYRWMGFIGNDYGIHGTNNPASIGGSVSMGCVRMFEKDLEELFEMVSIGTPVTVEYETIVIEGNPINHQTCVRVYPDVYGCGTNTMEKFKAKLANAGLSGVASNDILQEILEAETGEPVIITEGAVVRVNGIPVETRGFNYDGKVMVPLRATAEIAGYKVGWDGEKKAAIVNGKEIKGPIRDGKMYVPLEEISTLIQTQAAWNSLQTAVDLSIVRVEVNNRFLSANGLIKDGNVLMPLRELAEALGQHVWWNHQTQKAMLGTQEVKGVNINNKVYISLETAAELFKVNPYWNQRKYLVSIFTINR